MDDKKFDLNYCWYSNININGDAVPHDSPDYYVRFYYPKVTGKLGKDAESKAKVRLAIRALVARWDREGLDSPDEPTP